MRRTLVLAALLATLGCVGTEGGSADVPGDSVTVEVSLDPTESATYEIDLEAKTSGSDEIITFRTIPSFASLGGDEISTLQTWTTNDETAAEWPSSIEIGVDETVLGLLTVTMTNDSRATRAEFRFTVVVEADGNVPEPSEEMLYIGLALRDS